ncbi:hypothetical protein AX16_006274 [Volvariella volvacea WC 439]|nr:hypothetical protein AX16_006274 [Volvariella volvacea WC 439]
MLRLALKTVSLWIFLVSLLPVVLGFPIRGTNADRLARGLPPAPPVFRNVIPGGPTPVYAAKRTNTSPVPPPTYEGRIEVRALDGHVYGRVRDWSSGFIGGVNFGDIGDDLEVKLIKASTGSSGALYDILATNPSFPAPHYVGAAGTNTLGPGHRTVSSLATVYQSPPGSVPIGQNGVYGQSAIWKIDPATKELKVFYVNPDGSTIRAVIALNLRSNTLFFTGDLTLWNTDNNTPASEVKYFIV